MLLDKINQKESQKLSIISGIYQSYARVYDTHEKIQRVQNIGKISFVTASKNFEENVIVALSETNIRFVI